MMYYVMIGFPKKEIFDGLYKLFLETRIKFFLFWEKFDGLYKQIM